MSESNSPMSVPEMVHHSLLTDKSDVETKVGHVAKFDVDENKNDLEENNRFINYKKEKENNQFIGLTKEVCFIFLYFFLNLFFFVKKGITIIYK